MESSQPWKIRTDEKGHHEYACRKINFGECFARTLVSVFPGPAALPLTELVGNANSWIHLMPTELNFLGIRLINPCLS